jgi:DMSO/TMAO reductase YedYZ heme-binding membrane subunit
MAMTVLLTIVLLPVASLFYGAILALRDGGTPVREWVRILLMTALFLLLLILLPEVAPTAEAVALGTIVTLHVSGFYAWRLFGTGVPVDAKDGDR